MSDESNRPIIFLAFANGRDDRAHYLRNLPEGEGGQFASAKVPCQCTCSDLPPGEGAPQDARQQNLPEGDQP